MSELDVDALLFSLPDVTALVGPNIYAMLLPDASCYPSIAYRVKSLRPWEQGASTPGLTTMRLQCDTFAQDYGTAKSVRKALLADLVGISGAVGAEYIQSCQLIDANDNFESEILLFRLSLEVQVLY